MKKLLYYFSAGFFLLNVLSACDGDDEDDLAPEQPDTIDEETLSTNAWINEEMEHYYFWNAQMPAVDHTKEPDSEAYFNKLLFKDDDFSWITDDYQTLKSEYDGTPVAMGYDPAFYTFGNATDKVFIVVNYVYPGSGAETGGLRRGHIVMEINGNELTTNNYLDLYSGSSYSVTLGEITVSNNSYNISTTDKKLNLTSSIPKTDPIIHYEVIDSLNHKVGYLAYAEFKNGKDDSFLNSMDKVFTEFKTAGIKDMIVDLRYNPGGDVTAAIHLASLLAPAGVMNAAEVIVNVKYNATYQKEVEQKYPAELNYKFRKVASNLDLDRVYILTTSATASASELLLAGLDPHMEVVQVGDSTYGKYYGAYVLPDNDDEDKAKWAILPIVMKYTNTENFPDFAHGIPPDHQIEDDWVVNDPAYNNKNVYSYPLGNPADPLTKRAIELIAGRSSAATLSTRSATVPLSTFKRLPDPGISSRRNNLIIPLKPAMKSSTAPE
ncbi:MAG: S41 family peptidase [Prolixibacteraceae bacterium]